MKIVHIVEAFGGGVYSFLVDLCNELINNFEIVIIYSQRDQTPKNFKEDFDKRIRFVEIDMCRGLNICKNIKSLFQIKNILKNEKPDIVHLHSSKAGFLGRIVCRMNKFNEKKIFYNPHGFAFLQQNESNFKRKMYFELEKFAAKLGGYIVGCSKGEYEEASKISNKCVNINNGINTEKIDNIIKESELDRKIYKKNEKIIIGTVGRICYQKNPSLFNKIAEKFPEYNFVWIGDGDLKNELKSNNIKITGWLSQNEVIENVLELNIFILTSLWEGLPIALLEVMYLKKVCIVSNVIGNKDVIKNYNNGFIAKSEDDFIKYINLYNENIKLMNEMEVSAYRSVTDYYNTKKMIKSYEILYNK